MPFSTLIQLYHGDSSIPRVTNPVLGYEMYIVQVLSDMTAAIRIEPGTMLGNLPCPRVLYHDIRDCRPNRGAQFLITTLTTWSFSYVEVVICINWKYFL